MKTTRFQYLITALIAAFTLSISTFANGNDPSSCPNSYSGKSHKQGKYHKSQVSRRDSKKYAKQHVTYYKSSHSHHR